LSVYMEFALVGIGVKMTTEEVNKVLGALDIIVESSGQGKISDII